MTDPAEMIAWLDRRIASAQTWLADHGRRSKSLVLKWRSRPRNTTSPGSKRSAERT